MQQFYKGRTNNHLTWVMVDATDFATPESALSAATKIKIYGKVRGGTGVNFVSSGTGSLTNDIQHVGASALGIYTIALAKADLSDASAAWYDQYIISLSATGAAYQTLVVDGGIDASAILAMSAMLSDAHSAAILAASNASEAQSHAAIASSRALVIQSHASQIDSVLSSLNSEFLSRVPKEVSARSQVSDLSSDLRSYLVLLSDSISNLDSAVNSQYSDLASKIGGVTATLSASDMSDIASRVESALASRLSDILSAAEQTNSRVLLVQSRLSDFDSRLVSDVSDIRSMLTALSDAISDAHSDLASKIGGVTATLGASDISDIASAVWAHTVGTRVDSRILVGQSYLSDIRSHLSDLQSDFQSRVPKAVATQSLLSDVHSDLKSALGDVSVTITASDISDIASAVVAALPITSVVSDIYSLLSDLNSNFHSRIPKEPAARSQVLLLESVASDAASAAQQASSRTLVVQSRLSDLDSRLASDLSDVLSGITALSDATSNAYSAAAQANSRALLLQSRLSDLDSRLVSDLSDVQSAVAVANSRVLLNQSRVSDIYSLLSDLHSDVAVMSGVQSDIYSALAAGVELGASTLSDLRSAIAATELDSSDLSDIASAVWARTGSDPAAVVSPTGTMAAKLDWLTALSRNKITQTATVQSLRNDADSADIASAAVSDDGTTFTRNEFGN